MQVWYEYSLKPSDGSDKAQVEEIRAGIIAKNRIENVESFNTGTCSSLLYVTEYKWIQGFYYGL